MRRLGLALGLLLACAAAHADTLDDIRARGELIVGMEVAFKPYEFFVDGRAIGLDCDIAQRFADKLGAKATLVDTAWNGIIPALYVKKFDLIISGMAMTKERAQRVQFSMPYSESGPIILVRAGDTAIHAPADLAGKTVGTQLGSSTETFGNRVEAQLKADGKPGFAALKMYDHFPETYIDLINKRLDAVLIGRVPALTLTREQPGKFAIAGTLGYPSFTGAALRKDDTRLVESLNALLAEMKTDGSLTALQEKWLGTAITTPNAVPDDLP